MMIFLIGLLILVDGFWSLYARHNKHYPDCPWYYEAGRIIRAILGAGLITISLISPVRAEEEYPDELIVNAIYRTEGSAKAHFAYGIRSIPYKTIAEARRYCFNTVRNQHKRHANHKCNLTFLECLAERYCPTQGKLTKAERKLNGNWLKNVRYFLAHNGRKGEK